MSSATWVLIGEAFLILVSLVIAITIYAWRKKKRQLAALDILLTNLSEAEPERKTTLIERLKNSYQIDEAKAKVLSDEIFGAERRFIQQLIQLLLNTETDKIARFNEDMYALLSPYWELLPVDCVADSPAEKPGGDSIDIPPVTPESGSDGLPSDDYDLEVAIEDPTAEESEAESTSTQAKSTLDIEIDENAVVDSGDTTDQSLPGEDPTESDHNEATTQPIPEPSAEEHPTDKVVDDTSTVPAQDEAEQKPAAMEPNSPKVHEPSIADIAEDEDLAEEAASSVDEEEDEPSWGDAFDEAAQGKETKAINLDENDEEKNNSKKTPKI